MRMYTHTHMHDHTPTHLHMYIYTHTYMHTRRQTYIQSHVLVRIHTNACVYGLHRCTCVNILTSIYIYIYIHIHLCCAFVCLFLCTSAFMPVAHCPSISEISMRTRASRSLWRLWWTTPSGWASTWFGRREVRVALMVGGNPKEHFLGVPRNFSCKHASHNGLARFSQRGGVFKAGRRVVFGEFPSGGLEDVFFFEVPFCFSFRRNPKTTPKQELVPLLGLPSMRFKRRCPFQGASWVASVVTNSPAN